MLARREQNTVRRFHGVHPFISLAKSTRRGPRPFLSLCIRRPCTLPGGGYKARPVGVRTAVSSASAAAGPLPGSAQNTFLRSDFRDLSLSARGGGRSRDALASPFAFISRSRAGPSLLCSASCCRLTSPLVTVNTAAGYACCP